MEFNLASILVFMGVGVGFSVFLLLLARLVRPLLPGGDKSVVYECGERPTGSPWVKFNIRFYVVALIFVIFDVEVVFLYPWAVVFRQLGLFAFVEMLVFLIILFVGLAYVWKKGDLEWVRPEPRLQWEGAGARGAGTGAQALRAAGQGMTAGQAVGREAGQEVGQGVSRS